MAVSSRIHAGVEKGVFPGSGLPWKGVGWLFFAVFWGCFAFYSGGGWNQNARFAQVRALVEQRRFSIDDYLVYRQPPGEQGRVRLPIRNALLEISGGSRIALGWRDQAGRLTPIVEGSPAVLALEAVAASGDVSFSGGHFYPNKPPGTTFLAVPAYGVLYTVERWLGWNPDEGQLLTLNAWLTTAFSIGLISAIGTVVLYRIALRFTDARAAFAVALTAAFGTMAFPNGTMLFDHNLTAVLMLASFSFLIRARNDAKVPFRDSVIAGFLLGGAIASNYLAVLGFILLAIFAGQRLWAGMGVGLILPVAALAGYHTLCFGSPWALASTGQNPLLLEPFPGEAKRFLGMFSWPNPGMALILLISPFRGLFAFSPVLLLAVWGLWKWAQGRGRREAFLCAGMFALFLTLNAAYCGWHGGYGVGPRYLAPAVPFLALGLVGIWRIHPRLCAIVAGFSVAMQLALTATDPLSPIGMGKIARLPERADWSYNPLTEYALPFLIAGRPEPLLGALREEWLGGLMATLPPVVRGSEGVRNQAQWLREEMRRASARREVFPLPLAAFLGPVSVNPMGIFEGDYFQITKPGSHEARWNSFNAGEFLFPGSRWSLAVVIVIGAMLIRMGVKNLCLVPKRS